MGSIPKVRVYTDGKCQFCWWARGFVEPYDSERRIDFRDFNDPAIAAETPYSRPELLRQMHVLTPDGRWHCGYLGWLAILKELPTRRWLARILALPPLRWLGPGAYTLLAANRYRIPTWLLTITGAPRPCTEGCELPQQSGRQRV